MNLPGGQTHKFNVCPIRRISPHPAETDEDSIPECISDTENCLNWNGDWDNPNEREVDREADNKSDVQLDNGIEDQVCPEWQDVRVH